VCFWRSVFDCRYVVRSCDCALSLALRGFVVVEPKGMLIFSFLFRSVYLVVLRGILLDSPECLRLR